VTPQDHFTLGATYALSRETELSFMYARAFGSEVRGTGPSTGGERGHVPALAGRSLAYKW
jgi:long-chain fatty acid transport protein